MRLSVVASTLEVASSRIRMRGSESSARAIATRWRWPPESVQAALADQRVVARRAGRRSTRPAPARRGRRAPPPRRSRPGGRRRCSRAAWRRTGTASSDTTATSRRSDAGSTSRTSTPSTSTAPSLHVVEARHQHHERGLARAGRADERHGAARLHLEVHVAQHGLAAVVAEGHVAQLHAPAARRQRRRAGRRGEPRLAVEQLEHPRARGHRALGHAERDAEHAHRRGEHQHVAVEGHEVADRRASR